MWETNKTIKDYYRLIYNPKDGSEGAVEIIDGPFSGLKYKYGDFRFSKPETDEDTPKAEYEFEVLHIPEEIRDVDYPSEMKESFDQLLLGILIDLVQEEASKNMRVEHDNTDGDSDIGESFERRVVYKNSGSLSSQ